MSNPVIEKFSTLLPRNGQGKRVMKSKLLTALGATGVLAPFPANPEHILERKILLQNAFNPNPSGGGGTTLKTNLAAYWELDSATANVTADATGNGNNLTFQGTGPLSFHPALIINGFGPNSANDGFAIPDNTALSSGSGHNSFTMQAWVNNSTGIPGAGFPPIIASWARASGGNFLLFVNSSAASAFDFAVEDLTATRFDCVGLIPVSNVWYHLIAGFDNTNGQIFLQINNGTRILTPCTSVQHVSLPFVVGNFSDFPNSGAFLFDECAFWNRVITTAEVAQLYNGGAGLPFSSFT